MRYLKIFENFNSNSEIEQICKLYNITNYTINNDGSIDVDGNVNLSNKRLTKLPLKFNSVSGFFWCSNNKLTLLEGCPLSVGGDFDCSDNQLTTLEGCPQSVDDDFDCSNNQLTSLEGAPKSVGGSFDCSNNKLTSLEGSPQSINFNIYFSYNQLTSLEGGPQYVGGNFYCSDNPVYVVWKLISPDNDKWDYGMMDLLNDYDIFRDDKTIVLDRLNGFLEDIGRPTVNHVEGYNLI